MSIKRFTSKKALSGNTPVFEILKNIICAFLFSLILIIFLAVKQVELSYGHMLYFFFIGMTILCVLNPWTKLHKIYVKPDKLTFGGTVITIVLISLLCTIPMGINPIWNGEIPEHRNQYEELAEAILEGHIDVHTDEDVSDLMAMDNPYDTAARDSYGVSYQWDHAFYDGHYYVYFGIVPALFLFVPYRAITGTALTSWKGTAVFSVFIIIAIFLFAYRIIQKNKAKVPLTVYLTLCSSASMIVLWYAVEHPALYCTAITGGICFALWSFYLLYQSFCVDEKPKLWKIFIGALCGALVFGCRPPIGVTEIALLPLLYIGWKRQISEQKDDYKKNILAQSFAFALPYIVVAILLMIYNYVRFESFFEFGQSYQLSVTDQTAYTGGILERFSIIDWANYTAKYLFNFNDLQKKFPWITQQIGLLIMHPVLLLAFKKWHLPEKEKTLRYFHVFLLISIAVVIEFQVLNSPFLEMRYSMDFVFSLVLAVLFYVFYKYSTFESASNAERKYSTCMISLSLLIMVLICLHFFTNGDANIADTVPELADKLGKFLTFQNMNP